MILACGARLWNHGRRLAEQVAVGGLLSLVGGASDSSSG